MDIVRTSIRQTVEREEAEAAIFVVLEIIFLLRIYCTHLWAFVCLHVTHHLQPLQAALCCHAVWWRSVGGRGLGGILSARVCLQLRCALAVHAARRKNNTSSSKFFIKRPSVKF